MPVLCVQTCWTSCGHKARSYRNPRLTHRGRNFARNSCSSHLRRSWLRRVTFIHPTQSKVQGEEIPDGRVDRRNKYTKDKGGEQQRKVLFAFSLTEASCAARGNGATDCVNIFSPLLPILKGQDCIWSSHGYAGTEERRAAIWRPQGGHCGSFSFWKDGKRMPAPNGPFERSMDAWYRKQGVHTVCSLQHHCCRPMKQLSLPVECYITEWH